MQVFRLSVTLLFAFAATMLMVNIKISVFGNHHVFVAEVNEIN